MNRYRKWIIIATSICIIISAVIVLIKIRNKKTIKKDNIEKESNEDSIINMDNDVSLPKNPLSIDMTDITDLNLKDARDDIKVSMKDFLEKFSEVHLLDSFTQSENSAVSEFSAQYLAKTNEKDIIKDDTAHVYRIPDELFDSFIEENFFLEQDLKIELVRQKRNKQVLLSTYYIQPMVCQLVIESIKTDDKGKYYIFGSNMYKEKQIEVLKFVANSKEPLDGMLRYPMLDFFAIVIDTGKNEDHNWKLYEWIVNP